MSAPDRTDGIDINAVARKVNRTLIEDGLLEIMLGVAFVLSAFHLYDSSFILNYLWIPIGIVLMEIIRRRIVYPRTGYVKHRAYPRGRFLWIVAGLALGMIVLAILITLLLLELGESSNVSWRTGLTIALILFTAVFFCFIAYWFTSPRWYMHGILTGVALVVGRSLNAPWTVFVLGIWICLVGGYVFIHFLRRNPLPSLEEGADAN